MKQQISFLMGSDLNAESFDSIEKFIFSNIDKNIIFLGNTIDEHYEKVMSSLGNSYRGVNKYTYGNILQAIKAIVNCKKQHLKTPVRSKAVAYLHQEVLFSPYTIQRVLLLFGVKMGIHNILEDSGKVFADKPTPVWMQRFIGGFN